MCIRDSLDVDCLVSIVDDTNLYSTQKLSKCFNTDLVEICDFLLIELFMGLIKINSYTDYWSLNFRYDKITNVMPLKRYQALRQYLCFVNSDDCNLADTFYKS